MAEKFAELVSKGKRFYLFPKGKRFFFPWRVGDLTLFKALTSGAFDRLNWQHSREFNQNFSKKSNAPGVCPGEGGAVLSRAHHDYARQSYDHDMTNLLS